MRILVLAPQWPDPPRQGAAIRNLHILSYLAERHDVTLLTFEQDDQPISIEIQNPKSGYPLGDQNRVLPLPHRTSFDRLKTLLTSSEPDMAWRLRSQQMWGSVRDVCGEQQFDVVHVEGIEMAPYGLFALELGCEAMTYDAHNAEYMLQRRAFTTDLKNRRKWPRAIYSLVQWWRLRKFERQVINRSSHVLAVSEADRAALLRLSPSASDRTIVLSNGVDTDYWSLAALPGENSVPVPENAVVFDGTMDFRPNIDAVLWFASEIWPLIRAERPNAMFFIVGRNPSSEVLSLADMPGITVTGAVDDSRLWVAKAGVYVVPMRMGSGVRLKVLQAMAMERAIVSTPVGAEGIAVENGRHLLVARSSEAFAQAVLALLAEPDRRSSLGTAARQLACERYAWPILLPKLDEIYPVSSSP